MVIIVIGLLSLFFVLFAFVFFHPQSEGRPTISGSGENGRRHKIYAAFGFHANLCHSYRLDTNTDAGFGKDIRIMRSIIETLDEFNRMGVDVKGIWDMDNMFTLEDVLPRHAPDIIRNIKRRVEECGDEPIIMSYNNALASAQTPEEFKASIEWAVTNEKRSGLKDVFGKCSPIVRPQEMMVTPGNFRLYQEMGIKALTLYYSAIPFDAFRMFVRPLGFEEAFNPLTYGNERTGEAMTVIPAYTIGDLLENVSLSRLVGTLRDRQISGEIDRDMLVFINFDADDSYWEGYDLPRYLSWLPNTGGLRALIKEVADLEYVEFTTLSDYLEDHPPVGEISFSQDTADGNFHGYNSWAEKATSAQYWTKVMENRRRHWAVEKMLESAAPDSMTDDIRTALGDSFNHRLRLISTTNYGMSAPFVTPERERVVDSILERADTASIEAFKQAEALMWEKTVFPTQPEIPITESRYIDTLNILGGQKDNKRISGGFIRLCSAGVNIDPEQRFCLVSLVGKIIPLRLVRYSPDHGGSIDRASLFIPSKTEAEEGVYHLFTAPRGYFYDLTEDASIRAARDVLKNEFFEITFSDAGSVTGVFYQGKRVLEGGSLVPGVVYGPEGKRKKHAPDKVVVTVENSGWDGVACLRLQGDLPLNGDRFIQSGGFDYRFTLMAGEPFLFIDGGVRYPETEREELLSGGHASLLKKYDSRWYETAPVELNLALRADKQKPFKVLKRNFLGLETSYELDYFRHSVENMDLANVNNHVTSEYVGVSVGGRGVALAMDNSIYSNFAFCPLKVECRRDETFRIKMNPFGTYFGRQYVPPTWGNRHGYQAALLAGKQYCSSAPSYNGFHHPFSVMIGCFDGDDIPEDINHSLIRFAHPPVVVTGGRLETWTPDLCIATGPQPPRGLVTASDNGGVYFHWETSRDKTKSYKVYCGREPGKYDAQYLTTSNSVYIEELDYGRRYYATVAGIDENGQEGPQAPEIGFTAGKPAPEMEIDLPLSFQFRVMWTTLFK